MKNNSIIIRIPDDLPFPRQLIAVATQLDIISHIGDGKVNAADVANLLREWAEKSDYKEVHRAQEQRECDDINCLRTEPHGPH